MGNIVFPTPDFVNGTIADADQVDANNAAIAAQVNGNLDNGNIKAGANVDAAKLLDGSIDPVKFIATLRDMLGVTAGGVTRRGFSNVAAAVNITSTAYVTDAADSLLTVTQPANGITLVAWGVDYLVNSAAGFPHSSDLAVQVDGATNLQALSSNASALTNGGVNIPGFNQTALMLRYLAGAHTWRLVYKTGTGGDTSTFSNRRLAVVTFGF